MGYRFEDIKPPEQDDILPVFDVYNHETRTWSIPCFYLDVERPIDWHDPKCHDHFGWPNPDNPDHICQHPWEHYHGILSPDSFWQYIDMDYAIPIHFKSDYEGFNTVLVQPDPYDKDGELIPEISDLNFEASIREEEDWIIDITFKPNLQPFAGKTKEFLFNVFVVRGDEETYTYNLLRGRLVVLPG